MPIYEYECGDCKRRFEKMQRFDDDPMATCPACAGAARRVVSLGAVIYKGSGFYVTDQRKQQEIRDIGKPTKEIAEKYPQFSGLDKK